MKMDFVHQICIETLRQDARSAYDNFPVAPRFSGLC